MKVRIISGPGPHDRSTTLSLISRARDPLIWTKEHHYQEPLTMTFEEEEHRGNQFKYSAPPPAQTDILRWLDAHPPHTHHNTREFVHTLPFSPSSQSQSQSQPTELASAVGVGTAGTRTGTGTGTGTGSPSLKRSARAIEDDAANVQLLQHAQDRGCGKLASIIPSPYMYPVAPLLNINRTFHFRSLPQAPIIHTLLTHQELTREPLRKRLDVHRRGFWVVPVFLPRQLDRLPVSRASIPVWPRGPLGLQGESQRSDQTTNLSVPNQFANLEWSNARLYGFYRLMCKLIDTGRMGHMSIQAFFAPVIAPNPLQADSSIRSQESYVARKKKQEAIRNWGDHLRIWCDAQVGLVVREAMKEITTEKSKERCIGDGIAIVWCDESGRPLFLA